MTNPQDLLEYRGIRVGDQRKLTSQDFGNHWKPYLDDTFEIHTIWLTSAAINGPVIGSGLTIPLPCLEPGVLHFDSATKRYDASRAPAEYINVIISSVEHPQFGRKTIGIEHFL